MWYIKQVLIAFDQLVNALFGGWADETLSAHVFRLARDQNRLGICLCNILDFIFLPWGENHCRKAYESERNRSQLSPEYRK